MSKFYCTFGSGQPLAGKVLPLIAKDEIQVRLYMQKYYNNQYGFVYTEKQWQNTRNHLFSIGIIPETELELVDIKEFSYE